MNSTTDTMLGTRVPDETSPRLYRTGDYGMYKGIWYGYTPNRLLANLAGHSIVVNEDGTITAAPSIWVNKGCTPDWHGYLERGVWRQV